MKISTLSVISKMKLMLVSLVLIPSILAASACTLSFKKYIKDDTDSFSLAEADSIVVDALVKELHVTGDPDEQSVSITLKGTIWAAFEPAIYIDRIGKTVTIRTHEQNLLGNSISRNDLEMTITIPAGYSGDISLSTVSGSIDFRDMDVDKAKLSSVSSDIYMTNINCTEADISTVSGLINYSGSSTGELRTESVSGDITLSELAFDALKSKNVSGDVVILGPVKTGDMDATTVSGGVVIETDGETGFTLTYSTVSGDLESGGDLIMKEFSGKNVTAVKGDGEKTLKVSTISGKLKID